MSVGVRTDAQYAPQERISANIIIKSTVAEFQNEALPSIVLTCEENLVQTWLPTKYTKPQTLNPKASGGKE